MIFEHKKCFKGLVKIFFASKVETFLYMELILVKYF